METSGGSRRRFAIVGAGAMGSLFAARLALAGHDPLLIARPSPRVESIARSGIALVGPDGSRRTVHVRVAIEPNEIASATVVLVMVKAWATEAALSPFRGRLDPEAAIVTLQNGLGNGGRLHAALGAEHRGTIAVGVTSAGAMRTESGEVHVAAFGPAVLGTEGHPAPPALHALAAFFSDSGLPTTAVDDVAPWIWRKLAVNAAINGLSALGEVPNGAIVADPDLRAATATLAAEVEAVARAEGIAAFDAKAAVIEVAEATASNHSSMWRDLRNGVRTEVDAIQGAVAAAGRRLGVPTPANQLVAAAIRARERAPHDRGG